MRKEKILEILENAKDGNGAVPMRLVRTAFDKLSEPCEDTISRQVALNAVDAIGHIATMPDGDKCLRRSAVKYTLSMLPPAQPDVPDTNVGDIDKFIDGIEEIFADLRERHVDNSVCGLCEYDGAYIGQSGDWCNECPGFERDDCFKLSDKTRKEWTEEIIKALPEPYKEVKDESERV